MSADLSQSGKISIKRVHFISYVILPGVCAWIAHVYSSYYQSYFVSIRFRLRIKAMRSLRSELYVVARKSGQGNSNKTGGSVPEGFW